MLAALTLNVGRETAGAKVESHLRMKMHSARGLGLASDMDMDFSRADATTFVNPSVVASLGGWEGIFGCGCGERAAGSEFTGGGDALAHSTGHVISFDGECVGTHSVGGEEAATGNQRL